MSPPADQVSTKDPLQLFLAKVVWPLVSSVPVLAVQTVFLVMVRIFLNSEQASVRALAMLASIVLVRHNNAVCALPTA